MTRLIAVLLAALALGATASAAEKPGKAFKPTQVPAAQTSEADLGTLASPSAPMMPRPQAPAMSPQSMIDSLSAIKGSRDGTQSEVGPAPRVQRMLGKQSGKIGGGGGEDGNKKKGGLKRIAKTSEYPYTTMGVLASGCTGTVVMKRFVLTAAWCVYDLKAKKFYENLDFFPAMDGKKTPFGQVAWKNVWVAKGFAEKGDLNFGYGLVELDQDIGDQTGWFGFGDVPNFNFKSLTLTGYPFAGVPAQTMWETKCPVQGVDANAVFYTCPGDGKSLVAMLGSPIWFKGKADDAWQIVGIHVTAQNDQMNSWWAARLNKAHTETIIGWASGTDQPATEEEDEGTDEQVSDEEETEEEVTEAPECTCEEQATQQ